MSNLPMAAPYTKYQFTRDVYGGTNVLRTAAFCDGCGMTIYGVHADQTGHVHCRDCKESCQECRDFLHDVEWLAELFDDNDLVVTIPGKSGKECFGFYAHVWWKLDNDFQRIHQVKNRDRIRDLDRRSGRDRLVKARKAEKSREQALAEYRESQLQDLVCDCWDEKGHDSFSVEQMFVYSTCPVHGESCGHCGAAHPLKDLEG